MLDADDGGRHYDDNFVLVVQRLAATASGSGTCARRVVLATGAYERPLVFPDNDRPGMMLAGAARTYLERFGSRAGRPAVFTQQRRRGWRRADARRGS